MEKGLALPVAYHCLIEGKRRDGGSLRPKDSRTETGGANIGQFTKTIALGGRKSPLWPDENRHLRLSDCLEDIGHRTRPSGGASPGLLAFIAGLVGINQHSRRIPVGQRCRQLLGLAHRRNVQSLCLLGCFDRDAVQPVDAHNVCIAPLGDDGPKLRHAQLYGLFNQEICLCLLQRRKQQPQIGNALLKTHPAFDLHACGCLGDCSQRGIKLSIPPVENPHRGANAQPHHAGQVVCLVAIDVDLGPLDEIGGDIQTGCRAHGSALYRARARSAKAGAKESTWPNAPALPAAPADAVRGSWVARAPAFARPYLQLSRYDRPAGFWLLGLPCLIGLALARASSAFVASDALLGILFIFGAVAMRGAGCTYNDILDRAIDAKVARTALRPLPSGLVTLRQAWLWLLVQCLIGLGVLLTLPDFAKLIALGSIPMIALYPLMKRITWWPQVWLGLTFNWGVLVAVAAAEGAVSVAAMILYIALVFWTLGYDTIYAIQDREDDALIGVRSTARRFGDQIKSAVSLIYAICIALAALAGYLAVGWIAAAATLPFALHLLQQAIRLEPADGNLALRLFRANRDAGLLLFAGWGFIAIAF